MLEQNSRLFGGMADFYEGCAGGHVVSNESCTFETELVIVGLPGCYDQNQMDKCTHSLWNSISQCCNLLSSTHTAR
jgi:hypothetical protein